MGDGLARLLPPKVLKGTLLFLVVCFSLIRFVNLNADFPPGITLSGALYTDEGSYSVAAVRHVLTGQWYQAGDVHMAVPQPVGQILHRISFALFGLSLSSARLTIVVSYLLLMVLAALLIRRSFGDYAALLTALLLASNYVGFAFSRLATMDLLATFFVVASLFVAGGRGSKDKLPRLLIASLLLGAGILTKANAVFAVPLLAFIAWRNGSDLRERILFLTASVLTVAVLYGGYRAVTSILFPGDHALYRAATTGNFPLTFHDWGRNLLRIVFVRVEQLGEGLVDLAALFTALALAFSSRFRRDPLVHLLIGYVVVYIGVLSLDSYGPSRYNLPLLVPFAGLCATACVALMEKLREMRWPAAATIPAILVVALSLVEVGRIAAYLSRPRYSFYDMTHAVGEIVQKREGTARGVLLYGDIASSVSLEIGTNAVNSLPGTDQVRRIGSYHPRYMIVHTSNIAEIAASEGAVVTELGAWDVFGNYFANGEPVRLYSAQWPGEDGDRPGLPGQTHLGYDQPWPAGAFPAAPAARPH